MEFVVRRVGYHQVQTTYPSIPKSFPNTLMNSHEPIKRDKLNLSCNQEQILKCKFNLHIDIQ
jgi:hypothetical protein